MNQLHSVKVAAQRCIIPAETALAQRLELLLLPNNERQKKKRRHRAGEPRHVWLRHEVLIVLLLLKRQSSDNKGPGPLGQHAQRIAEACDSHAEAPNSPACLSG